MNDHQNGKQNRILVVDDHVEIRSMLRMYLESWDYIVHEAADGPSGLEEVAREHPDLIVLDHHMPGMSGLAMLTLLRQQGHTTPVVILTADPNQTVAVQCFRSGANDFIPKPFDPDFLEVVIRRLFRLRAAEDRAHRAEVLAAAEVRAAQLKDRLLLRLGHHLKAPLQQSLGHLASLARELRDDDHNQAARIPLVRLLESAERLDRMINRLTDLALLEANHGTLDLQPYDLAKLLQRARANVLDELQCRQVRLLERFDPPCMVKVDRDGFVRVLTELLANATALSPHGAVVQVAVDELPDRIRIRIMDSGPGIVAEELPSIFFPFSSSSLGESGKGVGLGLAIAQRIVTHHHGLLEAVNNRDGGATFMITLFRDPPARSFPATPNP
ncbi:MAG: response regulator [Magnetococcales bacterium]|nr:response regulator [Magnetococcales bacterium]